MNSLITSEAEDVEIQSPSINFIQIEGKNRKNENTRKIFTFFFY
jgi:hypothetical protein